MFADAHWTISSALLAETPFLSTPLVASGGKVWVLEPRRPGFEFVLCDFTTL